MIEVRTCARLHLGLLDNNGEQGRLYGSIGLAIKRPQLILQAETADELCVEGSETSRITAYAERFIGRYGVPRGAHLNLLTAIPAHVGLGSGTQLGLAVGAALARLAGLRLSVADIAVAVERGVHSGIGIATFQHGGFVLDGGHRILPLQSGVSEGDRQVQADRKGSGAACFIPPSHARRLAFCDGRSGSGAGFQRSEGKQRIPATSGSAVRSGGKDQLGAADENAAGARRKGYCNFWQGAD